MNILYINHYAGSLSMGMEFRPYYLAREWEKMGHNVRIIGADYSHLRKQNPEVKKDFEIQNIEGVEYQWLKTGRYVGNGVARALTMFEFCGKLIFHANMLVKDFHPDVVISSSTYPLDAYPSWLISKLAKGQYIHEAHDLWPLTLTELAGMSKVNPFVILLGIAERFAYRKATKVVSLFPNAIRHMETHGLRNKDKFVFIPNGIAKEDWESVEEMPEEYRKYFDENHKKGKFIICYLGGHALSNALDTLIDTALNTSSDDKIAYVLIGKGVEKNRLIEKAKGLENVTFLSPVLKTQVPSVLKAADALYVGAKPCSLYRFGISMNKIYDYMMSGKVILYGVDAFNNDVEKANCGISIKPEDPVELEKAIRDLMELSDAKRQQMGRNGHDWVIQNCEYGFLARQFAELFEERQ